MAKRDNVRWYYSPIAISIIVFVLVAAFVIVITGCKFLIIKPDFIWGLYNKSFLLNVLVEAHGMLFDILVIGILILSLNRLAEKRITNQRYLEEIDDFRGWQSDEAAHRIAGNVRRLNRNKYKGIINLEECHMRSVNLNKANLRGACLEFANLNDANLQSANLEGANLQFANLVGASLSNANLEGASLAEAQLGEAKLRRTNLRNANLISANLSVADLRQACLEGTCLKVTTFIQADLREADLKNTNLQGANLSEANLAFANLEDAVLVDANLMGTKLLYVKSLAIHQLSEVVSLYNAELDPELMKQVKEKYPQLLEKPKEEESIPDE